MKKFYFLVLFLMTASYSFAGKNQVEYLGKFGNWSAYSTQEKSGKLCYMASVPEKSEGKYKRRGDILLIVTHRPKEKSFDVISFTAGYTYKQDSTVLVQIDTNKNISLFTHEDTAWGKDTKTDIRVVNQMKAGNKAVFKGKSSLGTNTIDTFSLKGFTKAYKAINSACGRK